MWSDFHFLSKTCQQSRCWNWKRIFTFGDKKIPLGAQNDYWNACVCFTDIDILLELLRLKAGRHVTFGISVTPEIQCKGPTVCWKNFLRRVSWDWTGHSVATWLPDASTWKLSDSAATRTHVPSTTATDTSFTGRDVYLLQRETRTGTRTHHYQSAWIKISISIE